MNDSDEIMRYLYLGSIEPFYIRKNKPLNVDEGRRALHTIKKLVDAISSDDPEVRKSAEAITIREHPLDMVVKAMQSGTLVRHDECMFTLAFLARTFIKPEEKHKVYEVVPTLIEQAKDLFQFVYFYMILRPPTNPGKGLGHGMKMAITKWYDKHSAEELAVMIAADARCHNWSHRDLLRQAHVTVVDQAKMGVLYRVKGSTNPRKRNESDAPPPVQCEELQMYLRMKEFKAVDNAPDACSGLREYRYPFPLVPVRLLRAPSVWESLFPHMPYDHLVKVAPLLQDFKLLRGEDSQLSIAYGRALNSLTSVRESKLHPIFIYQVMRLFEERQRYRNTVKEAIHSANNSALKNATANPSVMRQFSFVLNESFLNYESTGLHFFVTLDLRKKQSKKRVFNSRLMSCQAAYVLLTLPMIKREQHMTVMTYTEDRKNLRFVDITREQEFYGACDAIQHKAVEKTKVKLWRPIEFAIEKRMPVDVFIIIVDSLIRVNPLRRSPLEALNKYNETMRRNARCIIVNLCRSKSDLDHADRDATKGVLEILGCSEETPKLIDAYARHHFS